MGKKVGENNNETLCKKAENEREERKNLICKIGEVLEQDLKENGKKMSARATMLWEKFLKTTKDKYEIDYLLEHTSNFDQDMIVNWYCKRNNAKHIYSCMCNEWVTKEQMTKLVNALIVSRWNKWEYISKALTKVVVYKEHRDALVNKVLKSGDNDTMYEIIQAKNQTGLEEEIIDKLLDKYLSQKELRFVSDWYGSATVINLLRFAELTEKQEAKIVDVIAKKAEAAAIVKAIECLPMEKNSYFIEEQREKLVNALKKSENKEVIDKTIGSKILTKKEICILKPIDKTANETKMDELMLELDKELIK